VGSDALPDSQRFVIEVCSLFKDAFLRQDAFDEVDRYTSPEKQARMLALVLLFWRRGSAAIRKGATFSELRRLKAVRDIVSARYAIAEGDAAAFDRVAVRLERAIDDLEGEYGR
jgi:V/A-type H+-transporting ATPase subunit A